MSDLENNNSAEEQEPAPFQHESGPSVILEYFEEKSGDLKPKVTEKLITFYKLSKIDKELFEIEEEKSSARARSTCPFK